MVRFRNHWHVSPVLLVLLLAAPARAHYYTPLDVGKRLLEKLHPGEKARGVAYYESLVRTGNNIRCASSVVATANGFMSKVFHQHIIGDGLVELVLRDDIPDWLRTGMFDFRGTAAGLASWTTGRGTGLPFHIKPDVTGLTVALVINGKLVVLTTTASRGAFAATAEGFSHLGSFSAASTRWIRGWHDVQLQANIEAFRRGDPAVYPNHEGTWEFVLSELGGAIGEGRFFLDQPQAALFTLLPAVLSGRSTVFTGYKKVGYGSGHSYLVSEDVEFEKRRAFRFGFRLAENELNREIRSQARWFATQLLISLWKREKFHLTSNFLDISRLHDVEYEMYVQEENNIESPHLANRNPAIPVATLKLLQRRERMLVDTDPWLYNDVTDFFNNVPMNPGFGYHLPLGDLGVGRAAGPIVLTPEVLAQVRYSINGAGGYWESQAQRLAFGLRPRELDEEAIQQATDLIAEYHRRYHRVETTGLMQPLNRTRVTRWRDIPQSPALRSNAP